jgi:acyl-coenzyme A synthetase/AMP-(fatty) acid ligase
MAVSGHETEACLDKHLAGILADMNVLFDTLFQELSGDGREFIAGAATRRDVHGLASRFYAIFLSLDPSVPVCLAAEGRDVIAAALLAAVASGRVLTLPHSFSARALRQMQELTGFTTAIVDVDRELSHGIKCIHPPDSKEVLSVPLPESRVNPDAELLKLFTGGSTGAAKIWSKSVANIFEEAQFMASRYAIDDKDCILATITPYHIYGLLFSVAIPLVASARIVAESPFFPAEIATSVENHSVTILASVPAHYRALQMRSLPSSLRLAFSSAGMLPEKDNNEFCSRNRAKIVEVYGSTETGGLATRNRAAEEEFFSPLEPIEWQILDERLTIRSPFLSPEVPREKGNWFLSGDRVRQQGKDTFSLHGRADAITKVAGERVDLDEIRDLLQQQKGVAECVVLPLEDDTGRGNRIAVLIRSDQEKLDLGPIKLVLSVSLEPPAMPKIFKLASQIPVRPNGKYDRDAIIQLLS